MDYYAAYSCHLKENGYEQSQSDPCLFYKIDKSIYSRTLVWFHVDDTLISSTHPTEISSFHQILQTKFQVTANYDVTSHLGISLEKLEDGSVKLHQPKLLKEIFDDYGSTLSPSPYPARVYTNTTNNVHIDQRKYLRLLGKLMYLVQSRPDISTALSYAATKSKHPTEEDYKQLLRIVSYLMNTAEKGLILSSNPQEDNFDQLQLTCYVDAAYLSHLDAASHTGYCIILGRSNNCFYSKSQKQKLIATSSTHAELRAVYELTLNLIFISNLFNEIGRPVKLPIIIFEDNQPTIDLVEDETSKINKSKHYLMIIQFLREQVREGLIKLKKIPTEQNISNVLTKIITGSEFHSSFNTIMGQQS